MTDTKDRCCENGFFGQTHDCRKGKPQEPSKSEAREFWLLESRCTAKKSTHKTRLECFEQMQMNDNEVHVIEYSAYERMQKELELERASNKRLREDRDVAEQTIVNIYHSGPNDTIRSICLASCDRVNKRNREALE